MPTWFRRMVAAVVAAVCGVTVWYSLSSVQLENERADLLTRLETSRGRERRQNNEYAAVSAELPQAQAQLEEAQPLADEAKAEENALRAERKALRKTVEELQSALEQMEAYNSELEAIVSETQRIQRLISAEQK